MMIKVLILTLTFILTTFSNAVTFIAAKAGINMVAYIDDYILISPKNTAQHHFDTLASILSQLALPSKNKLHPVEL